MARRPVHARRRGWSKGSSACPARKAVLSSEEGWLTAAEALAITAVEEDAAVPDRLSSRSARGREPRAGGATGGAAAGR